MVFCRSQPGSRAINLVPIESSPTGVPPSHVSVWCYIQWRSNSKRQFLIVSIITTILALLTKEMAVALPPTIFMFELLIGSKGINTNKNSSKTKLNLIKQTILDFIQDYFEGENKILVISLISIINYMIVLKYFLNNLHINLNFSLF